MAFVPVPSGSKAPLARLTWIVRPLTVADAIDPTVNDPPRSDASIAVHARVSVAGAVGAAGVSVATRIVPLVIEIPKLSEPIVRWSWESPSVNSRPLSTSPALTSITPSSLRSASTMSVAAAKRAEPVTRPSAMSRLSSEPEIANDVPPVRSIPEPATFVQSIASALDAWFRSTSTSETSAETIVPRASDPPKLFACTAHHCRESGVPGRSTATWTDELGPPNVSP